MKRKQKSLFYWFIILSLFYHLFLYTFTNLFHFNLFENENALDNKPIEIQAINPDELEKLKRVGKKDGSKKGFAMDLPKPSLKSRADTIQEKSVNKPKLELSSLNMYRDQNSAVNFPEDEPVKKRETLNDKMEKINKQALSDIKENIATLKNNSPLFDNSLLNLKIELPEGVDQSELNALELKFYSFQKRIYLAYISALSLAYNRFLRENPNGDRFFNTGKELLIGKITFNQKGENIKIEIVQRSRNPKIGELFYNTLEGVNILQNPPVEFFKKQKFFNIYFHLMVYE